MSDIKYRVAEILYGILYSHWFFPKLDREVCQKAISEYHHGVSTPTANYTMFASVYHKKKSKRLKFVAASSLLIAAADAPVNAAPLVHEFFTEYLLNKKQRWIITYASIMQSLYNNVLQHVEKDSESGKQITNALNSIEAYYRK